MSDKLRGRDITQEQFEALLAWLDPDPARAGEKYEAIRDGLVAIFSARGCADAEILADETINRVTRRAAELRADYVGDPARYFYGVAKNIYLEQKRLVQGLSLDLLPEEPPAPSGDETERLHRCLDRCMGQLPARQRDWILMYYAGEKRAKIESRRRLAEQLGITAEALRAKTYVIRRSLERCMRECLSREEEGGE